MIFQQFVRKHQKTLLVFILLAVGVPMALFVTGSGDMFSTLSSGGTKIGTVGDIPVTAEELVAAIDQEVSQRRQSQPDFVPRTLAEDGTLSRIREDLIKRKLVQRDMEQQNLLFTRDYLADQLKKDPHFQTADGRLDADVWNAFVRDESNNWNAYYESLAEQTKQKLYRERLLSGARVLESDLRKQFESQNTEITIKFKSIELPVEPTEDEIRKAYDEDTSTRYSRPEGRMIAYVAFSLSPPKPAAIDEAVKRFGEGESFSVLAAEYSEGPEKETGGDLGWVTINDELGEPRNVLADLAVGAISEPVAWGRGYYIYFVEEERTNDAGQREVHARQILFLPTLTPEQEELVKAKANDFHAAIEQGEDFTAFAETNGLTVEQAGPISSATSELDTIPSGDLFAIRGAISGLEEGALTDVVSGLDNLYVAKVTGLTPSEKLPFEEVKDQVRATVESQMKREPEYQMQLTGIANDIKAQATSLADIAEKFPNLADTEIKEMGPFTAQTFDFSAGLMVNPTVITEAVKGQEPGALVGPINDFLGGTYFVEVVSLTPPTEDMWANQWPEERSRLRDQNVGIAQAQYAEDYIQYLQEQAINGAIAIDLSDSAMMSVLNARYPDTEATETTEATLPMDSTPASDVESLLPAVEDDGTVPASAEESAPEAGTDAADAPEDVTTQP